MYMDYNRLWRLLAEKGLSKTDLMDLTGISSRVLAKLSKNENVTTETLSRICSALSCRIEDVAECVEEERLSVFGAFKKYGTCVEENELFRRIRFSVGDQAYTVYQSKAVANKSTQIHCGEDQTVYWDQFHPVGHVARIPARTVLVKPCRKADETVIVLIKGKPSVIGGLDENGFVSSRGTPKRAEDVYVMSEAAFKLFSPKSPLHS